MKNVILKVLKYICWVIVSLIVLFNMYNFINLTILKKDLSTVNGYTYLNVVTGSMNPTIKIGDLIIIDTEDKDIKNGDIITFKDENQNLVTHRVIETNEDFVLTKGDANNTDDGYINRNRIVGKYVFKLKAFGYVIETFKSPFTLVIILVLGVLVCYILSIDKDGNVIDVDDEYKEFILYKEKQKNKKTNNKKTTTKKVTKKVEKKSEPVKKVTKTSAKPSSKKVVKKTTKK